jgi:hypothetical protein
MAEMPNRIPETWALRSIDDGGPGPVSERRPIAAVGAAARDVQAPSSPGMKGRNAPSCRILVLRSCRMSQFLTAVVFARRRHPNAEIVALSHRGHRQVLRAAGVDSVIEVPGRRFGLLSAPPWALAAVRKQDFDEVVIPQMNGDADAHVNLYRLVLALNAKRVVIVPFGEGLKEYDRASFMTYVLQRSCSNGLHRWEAAMFVIAMVLSDRYLRLR